MGKKIFFAQGKYRVRWKNNAVFSLEKTVLDRIPLYKRTVLKDECLYITEITFFFKLVSNMMKFLKNMTENDAILGKFEWKNGIISMVD